MITGIAGWSSERAEPHARQPAARLPGDWQGSRLAGVSAGGDGAKVFAV